MTRVDLTQPLPALDLDDEWLDEDDGSWDDGFESAGEPEAEPEPEPRRNRRERSARKDRRDRKVAERSSKAPETERGSKAPRAERSKASKEPQAAPKAPTGQTSALTDLILLLFKVGLVVVFLLILFTFFYGLTQVRDTSMDPAVKEGDIVIYYRSDKDYASGDPVVVEYNGELQVRRVVAVAGDTVDISENGGLIINGSTQIESGIYTETYPYTEGITFPVTVGQGEIFVLADNRTDATDSRIYGTVATSATKGSVMTILRRRGI